MAQRKWVIGVAAFLAATLLLGSIMALAAEAGSKNDPLAAMSYLEQEFTPTLLDKIDLAVAAQMDRYATDLETKYNRLGNEMEQRISTITAGGGGELTGSLLDDQELIDAIVAQVIAAMPVTGSSGGGGSEGGGGGKYTRVDLTNGKTVTLDIGSLMFMRSGGATCVASNSVGLIDLTSGEVIDNGKALVMNHEYACTIDGRGFKSTANNTIVFIMGTYSIT